MLTSSQIRQQFLDFFVDRHRHAFVPSSPVVPHDDPTLLFTNAGMNQFKPLFLGQEKRSYTRAVNSQKCIRAGGKHNDLDDVGRSRRHHTFFEMLGNWSFGDYFKQGAIEMSWELLTRVWKLDPRRLHVTCFEGDEKNGVPRDTEAADIWRKVANWEQFGHRSDDHIHYFGKDNFWEMGETGPCGPCTEIYIDRTPDLSGASLVNGDDPRVMEIWNNVFIQYNRNADRSLTVLPSQHVDTGMGFERISQVLQDVDSNYSIDLWLPFWEKLRELSGFTYGGRFPRTNAADPVAEAASPNLRHDIAFRVIGDHIRCLTFALTDGAVPSNEGRGYVLRRILRRAVRFGRQSLELRDPFLHKLVPVVVESMGDAFPELKADPHRVAEIVKDEELSFGRTLDRGIALFDAAADAAGAGGRSTVSADDAFKLHDTFGFPIDLTQIMATERGMTVDIAGYEHLMEAAREKARSGGKGAASAVYELPPQVIGELAAEGVAPTDDSAKFAHESVRSRVRAIWNGSNLDPLADIQEDQEVAVILDRTCMYAEMGGQVGDSGVITTESASPGTFDVETTRVVGGYVLHVGRVSAGTLRVGDVVTVSVSRDREQIERNHTGTHVLNWALREVLGDGVQQKGSLVDAEKLRFDFSHGKSLGDEEVARVEGLTATAIRTPLAVHIKTVQLDQAMKINGLRAVFGEKYPQNVRVVSIGAPVDELLARPDNPEWRRYSVEFCGGTHVASTSAIGSLLITSEESVSKGVRRLVAVTGNRAAESAELARAIEIEIARLALESPEKLPPMLSALQKRAGADGVPLISRRKAQAAIAELHAKVKAWEKAAQRAGGDVDVAAIAESLLAAATDRGGGKIVVGEVAGASDDQLRSVLDSLRKRQPALGALVAAVQGEKLSFVAVVSDDLIARGLKAGDWVREAAKASGGGGGGRPQMAQAGGKDASKLAEALEAARKHATTAIPS